MRIAPAALVAVAAGGCFSKPDFRGDGDAATTDARPDADLDAPLDAPDPCPDDRTPLPADLVIPRRQFFTVGDLDRNGLHDLAIFGRDPAGGEHVFVYFGDASRDLDIACWDHEIVAAGFHRIGGVRIEAGSRDDNPQHGTLFIAGLDMTMPTRLRLDEIVVASDRTFAGPKTAHNSGGTAPAWADDASAPPAFFVWRFVEVSSTEEIFFGGGDRLFTVPMQVAGIAPFATEVGNPDGVRVQQAHDIDAARLAIDDGTHVYIVPRGPASDPIDLPPPLDGAGEQGAPDGAVYSTQDLGWGEANVLGVRAPRHATAPAQTSLQIFDMDDVHDKPLAGVTPAAVTGPFLTAGVITRDVGDLGLVLAASLTTFDVGGGPAVQQLVMMKLGHFDDPFVADQFIALEADVLPAVTGGKFRADFDRNLLVIYPRRTAADPPTHSVCYEALTPDCLAVCGESTCAP